MTKEEIAKRFCKFELCTHRNGEGMCCLFNQDNCIFHRLEKENESLKGDLELWESGGCRATNLFECGVVKELKEQIEKMKCWCNCKNYLSCLEECCRKNISFEKGICYNCQKWEIKE